MEAVVHRLCVDGDGDGVNDALLGDAGADVGAHEVSVRGDVPVGGPQLRRSVQQLA